MRVRWHHGGAAAERDDYYPLLQNLSDASSLLDSRSAPIPSISELLSQWRRDLFLFLPARSGSHLSPMPIEFVCESCARLLRVPDGSQGAQCQCPACKAIVEIPDPRSVGMVEVGSPQQRSPAATRQLQIACPRCHAGLRCDASLLGTKGQCRQCKYIFLISTDAQAAAGSSPTTLPSWIFCCPNCSQLFEGTSEMEGRKGKCHVCGEVFIIELKPADAPKDSLKPSASEPGESRSRAVQAAKPIRPAKVPDVQLQCPSCDGIMEVPASAAGKTTACPFCQQLLQIPASQRPATEPTAAERLKPISRAGQASYPASPIPAKTPQTSSKSNSQTTRPGSQQSPATQPQTASSPWDDLSEIDLSSSGLGGDQFSNPYQAPPAHVAAGQAGWDAGNYAPIKKGVSFSNVFALVFERAFPNCLAGALIYTLALGAILAVIYGSLFLTGMTLRALQVRDETVVLTTIVIVMVGAFLVAVCIATAGFCMLCNGALASMRGKKSSAGELFSTGGAFLPMLVYMFIVTILGAIVGAIPQGLMYLAGPSIALLAALLGLLLSVGYGLLAISLCLTPFAILDGRPPLQAMKRSVDIFASHPGVFIGTILCSFLLYLGLSVVTCGLGTFLLVGFPFYVMAAIYCLTRR